jgi:hypothetical protein
MDDLDKYDFSSPHFLRDWFAGQALAGESANSEGGIWDSAAGVINIMERARLYYRIADAMLLARSETPSNLPSKAD